MDSKNFVPFILFPFLPYISVSQNPVCLDWQNAAGNSCYHIYHKQLPWADAFETCRKHYGQLAHIYKASVHEELVKLLTGQTPQAPPPSQTLAPPSDQPRSPPSPPEFQHRNYWIGARFTDGYFWWVSKPNKNDTYEMKSQLTNYSLLEASVVTTSLYLSSPKPGKFVCNASTVGLSTHRTTQLFVMPDDVSADNLDDKEVRRSAMFSTLQFLSRSAINSSAGSNSVFPQGDIDFRISFISSTLQLKNLSQDADTPGPNIWLSRGSRFIASVSQNWSDSQKGTAPMELTVLSVKFPRLEEETISEEGVYSVTASDILSYTVFVDGKVVSVPVNYKLPTQVKRTRKLINSTHTRELQCGFMEEVQLLSNDWGWSTEGCSLVSLHQGYALCSCNHTTNFALLMQIVPIEISKTHSKALSVITYAGCGISIASSLLALTVFVVLRLYTQDRTFIHINLVVSLLLLQAVFLAGASQIHSKDTCTSVSVCLHYLSLDVFCWMLVEGIHLYRQVVQVFGSACHKKIYAAIGYVLPACIVGVAAVVRSGGYSDPDRTSCWLSMDHYFHWAFIGPAILIIVVNIVITGQVLRIVVSAAHVTKQQSAVQVAGKGLLVLAPITGLTWAFAFMAVSKETVVFQYLFAIFNSLQGLFVFLIHCVFNSEVRNTWNLWISKKVPRRNLDSSSFGKNRKAPGSSQDTIDKARLHVIDLPRSSVDPGTSGIPKQIASVSCKSMDRVESKDSHREPVHSHPSPSVAWTM